VATERLRQRRWIASARLHARCSLGHQSDKQLVLARHIWRHIYDGFGLHNVSTSHCLYSLPHCFELYETYLDVRRHFWRC